MLRTRYDSGIFGMLSTRHEGEKHEQKVRECLQFLTMFLRFIRAQGAWSTWKGHQGNLKESWTSRPWEIAPNLNGPPQINSRFAMLVQLLHQPLNHYKRAYINEPPAFQLFESWIQGQIQQKWADFGCCATRISSIPFGMLVQNSSRV